MIERDAKPIGNRPPYKRVDLGARKPRKDPDKTTCMNCQYEYDDWPHCPKCGD